MTVIPPEAQTRIDQLKKSYPDPKSAIMPALYIAQEIFGYISNDAVHWVSQQIGVAPVHVQEVATFYTMYYKKPVGKYHVQICRTLSCALCGSKKVSEFFHKKLGLAPNEVSSDGLWSYEEVECLGSCGTAPMVQINDIFFENLTPEKCEELMKKIESEKPELRYSTLKDKIGEGLAGSPKSAVVAK